MAHILVVDDDRDLCNLLRTALERDGHTVTALYRGDAVTTTCPNLSAWRNCGPGSTPICGGKTALPSTGCCGAA